MNTEVLFFAITTLFSTVIITGGIILALWLVHRTLINKAQAAELRKQQHPPRTKPAVSIEGWQPKVEAMGHGSTMRKMGTPPKNRHPSSTRRTSESYSAVHNTDHTPIYYASNHGSRSSRSSSSCDFSSSSSSSDSSSSSSSDSSSSSSCD